jgi:hypothetical protein
MLIFLAVRASQRTFVTLMENKRFRIKIRRLGFVSSHFEKNNQWIIKNRQLEID